MPSKAVQPALVLSSCAGETTAPTQPGSLSSDTTLWAYLGMDDLGELATDSHFAGAHTQVLVGYIQEHLGAETLDAVLALAGDTRPLEVLLDDAAWSTYGQFRRLLEAAGKILGGPEHLADFATTGSLPAGANPEQLAMLQAFGSPSGVYALSNDRPGLLSSVTGGSGEEIGPTEWVINHWFRDGFEPFEEYCIFNGALIGSATRMFGLPSAEVVEEECQRAGAPACRYRVRWQSQDEVLQRSKFLESRVAVFQSRLEALQLTVADLVSGGDLHEVLTRVVLSAAGAVLAPIYVLAIGVEGSPPAGVYSQGVDRDTAARIATTLLSGAHRDDGYLVVEVASVRRRYGRLAAINPSGVRFFAQERGTLEAYGRLAAAALDSATAIEDARREAITATTLLELSVSLAATTTAEEAAKELVRAVPAIVDCDRALVVLVNAAGRTGQVAASVGYPAAADADFNSLVFDRAVEVPSRGAFHFDLRSDVTDPMVSDLMGRTGDVALTVVPILANDELLGWVVAGVTARPERLADSTERLGGLAAQAATTISNARMVDGIRAAQAQLVDAARQAGMAEIATNVLHSVGNVLNSVNVSANVVAQMVRGSKSVGLSKAVALMREHPADLGDFLTVDAQGKRLPVYLEQLASALSGERQSIEGELRRLIEGVAHISEIVSAQQSLAGIDAVVEEVDIADVVQDAFRMAGGSDRPELTLSCDTGEIGALALDRHRLLLILVNLITNALRATADNVGRRQLLSVRATIEAGERMVITVADNGEGIEPQNLTRIFAPGFSTDSGGHGFGLHNSALAAKEMGGALNVRSGGAARGARFVLSVPLVA